MALWAAAPARTGAAGPLRDRLAAFPLRAVALACVLIAATRPAAAQPRPIPDDFQSQARLRAGALYLTPSLRLDRLGIDTNVFITPEAERDFVVAVTPGLDTWLTFGRRAVLATRVDGHTEYFRRFAGERSFNPGVRSRLEVALGRVTAAVGGDHLRTRQRPGFEIDLRARRIVDGAHAGLSVDLAPRLALVVESEQERTRFDGDVFFDGSYLAETLNRNERAGRTALRWRRTALSTFVFTGEFREDRFVRSPDRDSDNVIVTAGGEFHPRALLSGSGAIGVRRFLARGSAVTDLTRIVAQADLRFRLRERTTMTFGTERDIGYSFRRDHPYYLLQRNSLDVTRRLGAAFDLTGSVVRDTYDYPGGSERRDVAWRVAGTLGYNLTTTNRVGFSIAYATRDSPADRWSYRGLSAGMVFDYGL